MFLLFGMVKVNRSIQNCQEFFLTRKKGTNSINDHICLSQAVSTRGQTEANQVQSRSGPAEYSVDYSYDPAMYADESEYPSWRKRRSPEEEEIASSDRESAFTTCIPISPPVDPEQPRTSNFIERLWAYLTIEKLLEDDKVWSLALFC